MRAISLTQADIYKGELILVNAEHPYFENLAKPNLVPAASGNADILLEQNTATHLSQVMEKINGWQQIVPVIAGVSFEIIQWAGRSESCLVNIVSKPGLMLQKLTTREPDLEMLEVAIASIEAIYDWRQFQAENRAAADGNSQKTDRSNAGVSQP